MLMMAGVTFAGDKPTYGGTFTAFSGTDPTSWDPYLSHHGSAGDWPMGAVYERLAGADWAVDRKKFPMTMLWIPAKYTVGFSMESYEQPDALTYIVHIRKGMVYHDKEPVNGREVTADDWKYSIDRVLGKGEFVKKGYSAKAGVGTWKIVESVTVRDRYTFMIKLKDPSVLFFENWGTELMPWLTPREVIDKYGDDFSWEHVVGSGPFQLVDQVSGSSFTFEKHPKYYGRDAKYPENQLPYVDKLKVLIIPDPSTQQAAMRTGKIDWMIFTGWKDGKSLIETNPELKYVKLPTVCSVIDLRMNLKPYSDIRVRRAMQMAIDLKGLSEHYYGGTASPYPFMILPDFPDFFTPFEEMPKEVQEAFTYNPEKAKALLKEAGYPKGFTQELPMSSAAGTETRDLTNLFTAYWEEIGIKTKIKPMEAAAYSSFIYGGTQQLTWIWSCGFWAPIHILKYWYGGQKETPWNFSNANNQKYNAMWDAIQVEPDAAKRDKLFKEAFAYGTSQFFYIAGPAKSTYRIWQPWIKGYQGEARLQSVAYAPTVARMWIDQELKRKMLK